MNYQHMEDEEPYGVQQLRECRMVSITKEARCCSVCYSVSSAQGMLFSSEGSTKITMRDVHNKLAMTFKYKQSWSNLASFEVLVVNCAPVTVTRRSESTSLRILDQQGAPKLKIKRPVYFLPNTYKIEGTEGMEIGKLERDGGDWDVHFPWDLEVRYKAALIAACVYYDFEEQRKRNRQRMHQVMQAVNKIPNTTPSSNPSTTPSELGNIPRVFPSTTPRAFPTTTPSSVFPSNHPSVFPTTRPSTFPSSTPSAFPHTTPSVFPSHIPSMLPNVTPRMVPQ